MANQEFLNAAARIEAAIASILEFAATTGNTAFIERITRLAIKKEIVLGMLLDEIGTGGNGGTECGCNGTVNATIQNTNIFISDVAGRNDVGDVTIAGQICPSCFVEGSTLSFTFSDDTPTPSNSFTFVATIIEPPSCDFIPTNSFSTLNAEGLGVITRADMSTVNVSFFLQLSETLTPGGPDSFFITFNSTEVSNPLFISYSSPSLPDSSIITGNCAT